jgi:hypothetical protein
LNNIVSFIKQQEEPQCLVASFFNPHDVYVAQHYDVEDDGYGPNNVNRIAMPLPHNYQEDLSKQAKPRAHAGMTWHFDSANSMQKYVYFYAHHHTLVASLKSAAVFDWAAGQDADFLLCPFPMVWWKRFTTPMKNPFTFH